MIHFLAAFLFNSCNKEDEFDPLADVYFCSVIKSTMVGNQLVYTMETTLRTPAELTEVYETGPDGYFNHTNEIQYFNSNYELKLAKKYNEKEPPEGTYLFTIKSADGREKMMPSCITKPFLVPAENISLLQGDYGSVEIIWDDVENADYYQVFYRKYGMNEAVKKTLTLCKTEMDATEFSHGEPYDLLIEIRAVELKGNPEIISSESTAQIILHVDEFTPWWYSY